MKFKICFFILIFSHILQADISQEILLQKYDCLTIIRNQLLLQIDSGYNNGEHEIEAAVIIAGSVTLNPIPIGISTTYETAKLTIEDIQKRNLKQILRLYDEASLGYGVYLNRFMHEVSPEASKADIIQKLNELNQTRELCRNGIPDLETLATNIRNSL